MWRWTIGLVLVLAVVACAPRGEGAQEPQPVQVGFLLTSLEKERYHKDRAAFERRVQQLGGSVIFDTARDDPARFLPLAQGMMDEGAQVLVIQPLPGIGDVVRAAHARGVPVIAYDRLVPGFFPDLYVTQDSLETGREQARYALRAAPRGKYVILKGTEGYSTAEEITRGNREVLEAAPGVEIVAEVAHPHWLPAEAARTMRRVLAEYPDVVAVLCNNSGLARGAIEALEEAGRLGRVYVAGADADLVNCQWVVAGRQGMDVLKGIKPLARAAAEAAVTMARGKTPKVDRTFPWEGHAVPTVTTPVWAFDASNIEEVVVGRGFHPREAIFGKPP